MKNDIIKCSFVMETADPDDVMTLCILAGDPRFDLKSVLVTPGADDQIGVVNHILKLLNKNIPVGARTVNHPKECVSGFHYSWLGKISPYSYALLGSDVLWNTIQEHKDLVILTGAALTIVGDVIDKLDRYGGEVDKIVIQGGFAGDSVVPEEYRLEKFKGKETCPTFNLNGDYKAALKTLESKHIINKVLVSKNVCHGVVYDAVMHEKLAPYKHCNPGFELMYQGMSHYLKKHKSGKAFHDPLAMCALLDESIFKFEEVEVYREKGEWGSRKSLGSNIKISVAVDMDKFVNILHT